MKIWFVLLFGFCYKKTFLPTRYSYLSVFSDDNGDIFAVSLLILYCSFSFVVLSSIVMTSFYILSERFSLKRKRLSDATVVSIAKWFCSTFL